MLWRRSRVRAKSERLVGLESSARLFIAAWRSERERLWKALEETPNTMNFIAMPGLAVAFMGREAALEGRLSKARSLLAARESEEHARRSVGLGGLGALLGALSLVLAVVQWYSS